MANAPPESFLMLPGMGDTKAQHLARAFRQSFRIEGVPRRTTGSSRTATTYDGPTSTSDSHPPTEAQPEAPVSAPDDIGAQSVTFDRLPQNFESLPEEEQLSIAMQLSME